jgi:hypothetical protein
MDELVNLSVFLVTWQPRSGQPHAQKKSLAVLAGVGEVSDGHLQIRTPLPTTWCDFKEGMVDQVMVCFCDLAIVQPDPARIPCHRVSVQHSLAHQLMGLSRGSLAAQHE